MEVKYHQDFKKSWDKLFHWKYAPLRWWNALLGIPSNVRWIHSRLTKGYATSDVWDFNTYIANIMIGGLKELKDMKVGCPAEYFDESAKDDKQCWKFDIELDKVIRGFESYLRLSNRDYVIDTKIKTGKVHEVFGIEETELAVNDVLREEWEREFEEGMDTLKKIYFGLWD